MQQIYRQSDEQFEVFTTVFSPQVCRRTRTKHVDDEKVVVAVQYRSRQAKELDLSRGDQIEVLFREDDTWWFGRRLSNGDEGYFPSACVEPSKAGESPSATPTLLRRGSVPVNVTTTAASCGCSSGHSTPRLLRKNSLRRPLGLDGPPGGSGGGSGSPSLLHRVLAKSRRKSCPHLPQTPHAPPHPHNGSINTGFQPD